VAYIGACKLPERDGWSNPKTGEAAEMAAFLETRAAFPDQAAIDRALLDALNPAPGERLLEAGCGSGLLCRQIAGRVAPGGHVTGIDISDEMVTAACQHAARLGLEEQVSFDIGQAEALDYPDGSFDAALAARLLLHVARPQRVVAELCRVVCPGGRVALMDWDFDTVAVDHPDRELTRRLLHWRNDHYGGNNWSGRQLVGLASRAGLLEVQVTPAVIVARDESAGFTQSLWRAAQRACSAGAITPAEQDAWLAELRRRIADGHFFASITYFIVLGRKG
jgi:ubiquinone/menaquinone biosynthesis C-methylase UbiE